MSFIDGIEFDGDLCKNHFRPGKPWQKLPRDELDLGHQKLKLSELASSEHLIQHPLLPPYSATQLSALEKAYDVFFPPILRFYLGSISREIVFSRDNASTVMSYFRPWKYYVDLTL